jgi:hypothetical protein
MNLQNGTFESEFRKLVEEFMAPRKLEIELSEYGYYCGDGCCYNYGTITTVNGEELPCHNEDTGTILRQVLEHLGHEVEISYGEDED